MPDTHKKPSRQQHELAAKLTAQAISRAARKQGKELGRQLIRAVALKDYGAAEGILLRHPQAIKAHTSYHMGVLSMAAALGDVHMCQLLLEYGADIRQQDVVQATPLIHAAAQGRTAVVQLLIDSKAGANLGRQWLLQQATAGGETAVMAAAKGGHLDTLQVLCNAGADVSAANSKGVTSLLLACKHNRSSVVQHLVTQCNSSCSQTDHAGTTPLMAAAAGAAKEVVALLLQHKQEWGLQLDAEDMAGGTAVVHAARGTDAQVLEMLAAAGLPLVAPWPQELQHTKGTSTACLPTGCTTHQQPLQPLCASLMHASQSVNCAVQLQVQHAAVQLQVQHAAAQPLSVGKPTTDSPGESAVSLALQRLQLSSIKDGRATQPPLTTVLGPQHIHPNHEHCTHCGQSDTSTSLTDLVMGGSDALLYVAAGAGSLGVVGWLLQQGIGTKCLVVGDQHNAVFAALGQGREDMVRYLIQQGASLEAKDKRGRTPLAVCAAAGASNMARLLVELGANVLAQDHAGQVPRQQAYHHGHRATAELLTQLARDKLMLPCCLDADEC